MMIEFHWIMNIKYYIILYLMIYYINLYNNLM